MTLTRVSVTRIVSTICPNTTTDEGSAVTVAWSPESRVDAEQLWPFIDAYAGRSIYCEALAEGIAAELWDFWAWPVVVTVRQLTGHGIEAEAQCP